MSKEEVVGRINPRSINLLSQFLPGNTHAPNLSQEFDIRLEDAQIRDMFKLGLMTKPRSTNQGKLSCNLSTISKRSRVVKKKQLVKKSAALKKKLERVPRSRSANSETEIENDDVFEEHEIVPEPVSKSSSSSEAESETAFRTDEVQIKQLVKPKVAKLFLNKVDAPMSPKLGDKSGTEKSTMQKYVEPSTPKKPSDNLKNEVKSIDSETNSRVSPYVVLNRYSVLHEFSDSSPTKKSSGNSPIRMSPTTPTPQQLSPTKRFISSTSNTEITLSGKCKNSPEIVQRVDEINATKASDSKFADTVSLEGQVDVKRKVLQRDKNMLRTTNFEKGESLKKCLKKPKLLQRDKTICSSNSKKELSEKSIDKNDSNMKPDSLTKLIAGKKKSGQISISRTSSIESNSGCSTAVGSIKSKFPLERGAKRKTPKSGVNSTLCAKRNKSETEVSFRKNRDYKKGKICKRKKSSSSTESSPSKCLLPIAGASQISNIFKNLGIDPDDFADRTDLQELRSTILEALPYEKVLFAPIADINKTSDAADRDSPKYSLLILRRDSGLV